MITSEGVETKSAHESGKSKSVSNGDLKKKKKKPRQRNRPRNKANRLKAEAEALAASNMEPLQEEVSTIGMKQKPEEVQPTVVASVPVSNENNTTCEQIVAEREARKVGKQEAKKKKVNNDTLTKVVESFNTSELNVKDIQIKPNAEINVKTELAVPVPTPPLSTAGEKSREQIKAEREAKKLAKQAAKASKTVKPADPTEVMVPQPIVNATVPTIQLKSEPVNSNPNDVGTAKPIPEKKPALTKAERRAIQEAQRAAKAQTLAQKQSGTKVSTTAAKTATPERVGAVQQAIKQPAKKATDSASASPEKVIIPVCKTNDCKVKLFNHLENTSKDVSLFINHPQLHPAIARLGEQYAKRTVVGSNARCLAFLNALKLVIEDFETPPKKEFTRSLESSIKFCVQHLKRCRQLAVSVTNAYKHIRLVLTQMSVDKPESELKENLCHFIDSYIENQIGKAAQAISSSMQEKICDGDVLLTFGCSSLINFIFEEAHRRKVKFRVIVVDSRPFFEGQELLRRLTAKEIPCSYVLINAVGFVMSQATKVVLGTHALLANGYVMARTGTAQVALVARSLNVPVLVCCETHKFSERFQTDAIVYNELGNPDDLILKEKLNNVQTKNKMLPLNLLYDITPPELVTAVVTEVSILPCTSVPVILRIKPTEIGYYS